MDKELFLKSIAEAIYWRTFTPKQKEFIEIVIDLDTDPIEKGTMICDFLGIERRGNRTAIASVLKIENK